MHKIRAMPMYKNTVFNYFGKFASMQLSKLLNIKPAAISQWGDIIPKEKALILEKLTNGALVCDLSLYE